jgi:hypothetical protein
MIGAVAYAIGTLRRAWRRKFGAGVRWVTLYIKENRMNAGWIIPFIILGGALQRRVCGDSGVRRPSISAMARIFA